MAMSVNYGSRRQTSFYFRKAGEEVNAISYGFTEVIKVLTATSVIFNESQCHKLWIYGSN